LRKEQRDFDRSLQDFSFHESLPWTVVKLREGSASFRNHALDTLHRCSSQSHDNLAALSVSYYQSVNPYHPGRGCRWAVARHGGVDGVSVAVMF
jgi:hypothetical protein